MSFSRVCSAMLAKERKLSVSAGSSRWYSRCHSVTSLCSAPMGPEKPIGNHFKYTENTSSSSSPSQNVGAELSR